MRRLRFHEKSVHNDVLSSKFIARKDLKRYLRTVHRDKAVDTNVSIAIVSL